MRTRVRELEQKTTQVEDIHYTYRRASLDHQDKHAGTKIETMV